MDTIVYENEQYDAPGGPASYCSLAARKQKHDVNLYTKFGSNYPLEEFFNENKIITHNALSSKDTTKFRIELNDSDRKLFVENMCDKIDFIDNDDDGTKLIACLCLRSTNNRSTLGERLSSSSSAGGRDMLPRWNLAMQDEKSVL